MRAVDPEHIIFLEGDYFSQRFEGLDAPFAPNLVYSNHNYTPYGFGPGKYPGAKDGRPWNFEAQREDYLALQGVRYTRKHNVPLWVGEFGAAYNGPPTEVPDRLRAMDDQLNLLNSQGDHWTTWTYKDINVMGWVQIQPDSAYARAVRPVLEAKTELQTDFWMGWVEHTPARKKVDEFAGLVDEILQDPLNDPAANRTYMAQALLSGYVAGLMQSKFVQSFAGMSEERIDDTLASFAFKNCQPHAALVDVLRKRLKE